MTVVKNVIGNSANIGSYNQDGRRSLNELWSKYLELTKHGWQMEVVTKQKLPTEKGLEIILPIYAFSTPLKNSLPVKAMWILGGVHGEEPAGPNAFFEEIEKIKKLNELGISTVFLPLLNPAGYYRDFRYEDEYRDYRFGHSATDSEHYLLQSGSNKPRSETPNSLTAGEILSWVETKIKTYQPELVIDHHEDRVPEKFSDGDPRNIVSCYVYASGKSAKTLKIAKEINSIFKKVGMPVTDRGRTRFGEDIVDGVVKNTSDGSIDEFLGVSKYFDPTSKSVKLKRPASTVIVVETVIPFDQSIALSRRVHAHRQIIHSYSYFWHLLQSNITNSD